MSEDENAAQQELESAPAQDEVSLDLDEYWKKLQERGLVKGPRPDPAKRVRTSDMRPIRYHGTNEDLLRDLGRCR